MASSKRKRPEESNIEGESLGTDVKIFIGKVLADLDKKDSILFKKLLQKTRYKVSDNTLQRYRKKELRGEPAVKRYHETPRSKLIEGDKLLLMVGYIYHHVLDQDPIGSRDVQKWLEENLFFKACPNTILKEAKEAGFSMKLCDPQKRGKKFTNEHSASLYLAFLKERARPVLDDKENKLVCSIDFTYTSYKNAYRQRFGIAGG